MSAAAVVAALLLSIGALSLGAYVVSGRSIGPAAQQVGSAALQVVRAVDQSTPASVDEVGEDIFSQIFGSERSPTVVEQGTGRLVHAAKAVFRLLLASLLAAMLAFRPHKYTPALRRNPHVAETQILLAVVASALMMIVADNAARAFGIFAAASLVRFRTNIRDPKEITVLLISLALGLAAGVGRWDLALILAIFSLIVLWLLEWREPQMVSRSMELKVATRNVVATQQALRAILKKHDFDKELRAIDRDVTEESPGSLVYSIDVSPMVSTDELSEELLRLDGNNVEAIEWDQKKSYSYLYQ